MQVSFLEVITDFIYSLETSCCWEIPAQFIYHLTVLKEESNIFYIGKRFCNLQVKKKNKYKSHLNIENEEFCLQ